MTANDDIWEVWQGSSLVCGREMGLTREQAENKVANEARIGNFMVSRLAKRAPFPPYDDYTEDD